MTVQTSQQLIKQAMSLIRAGNTGQAEIVARQVIASNKKDADGLTLLGLVFYERGDYDEAVAWHKKAVTIERKQPLYLCNLAIANAARGKLSSALTCFEKALKLQPDSPEALAGKADVLEKQGKLDRAHAILEPAIKAGRYTPKIAAVYARLLQRKGLNDRVVAFADDLLSRSETQGIERRLILLQLGKACEQLGEYDRAFEAYVQANEIGAVPFDIRNVQQRFDSLMQTFSRDAAASLPRATHGSELPVFIAGMARSGTTLLEQIIHAHPKAHAIGEIRHLGELIHHLPDEIESIEPFPQCVGDLTVEKLDRLATVHLNYLKKQNRGATRIVDKTLDNFQNLGVISLLFPQARIIHIRRHPLDTCFSCYFENLPPLRHPYSSDLSNLGLYYRQYLRLMDFWRENLDIPILEIHYEHIVEDQENQSRRIIEFLGLEWDERCLRFHEARRDVTTLSYDQVRKPIYKTAISRYKHYEKHLSPLREALGDAI